MAGRTPNHSSIAATATIAPALRIDPVCRATISISDGPGAGSRSRLESTKSTTEILTASPRCRLIPAAEPTSCSISLTWPSIASDRRLPAKRRGERGAIDQARPPRDSGRRSLRWSSESVSRKPHSSSVPRASACYRLTVSIPRQSVSALEDWRSTPAGLLAGRVLRALLFLGDPHRPFDTAVGIVDRFVRLRLVSVEPGGDRDLKVLRC